jgi:hypothetical protein
VASLGRGATAFPAVHAARAICRTGFTVVAGTAVAAGLGRLCCVSSAGQVVCPGGNVDYMCATSIPSNHGTFTYYLLMGRRPNRGAWDRETTTAMAGGRSRTLGTRDTKRGPDRANEWFDTDCVRCQGWHWM